MAKTTSFAITHFTVAFGVTYALTGDLVVGGLVAIVEPAINTVAYHFHEKIWKNIDLGTDNMQENRHQKLRLTT